MKTSSRWRIFHWIYHQQTKMRKGKMWNGGAGNLIPETILWIAATKKASRQWVVWRHYIFGWNNWKFGYLQPSFDIMNWGKSPGVQVFPVFPHLNPHQSLSFHWNSWFQIPNFLHFSIEQNSQLYLQCTVNIFD